MMTLLQNDDSVLAKSPAELTPTVEPVITPEQIVRMFNSRIAADQANAERALQDMGPAAVEALIEVVRVENKKFKRQRKSRSWIIGGTVGSIILAPLIYGAVSGNWNSIGDWSSFFTSFAGCSGIAAVAMGSVHKSSARVLAKIGDVRAVGPLTDMLDVDDGDVLAAVTEALTKLLPLVNAQTANQLSPEQVQSLCWYMGKRFNPPLTLSILNAMEYIGNNDSLPTIRALAAGAKGVAALDEVQSAAKRCLPLVEARIAREHEAQTLLRASAAKEEPAATLLRPAADVPNNDQTHLLRPAE